MNRAEILRDERKFMNETKIKQRFEKAFDAFFADENESENKFLSRADNPKSLQSETATASLTSAAFKNLIRQIVFFFPGTFLLYYLSIGISAFLAIAFSTNSKRVSFGEITGFACLFLAAVLMTWLGLGDVRKPKHFVIPASIICVGIFSGVILVALSALSYFTVPALGNLSLYIFPLALIVPFLAKGLVDRKFD